MLGSATPRHFVFDSPARFEGGRGYSRNDQKMGIQPDSNPNCGIPLIAAGRFEIRLSGGAARLSNFGEIAASWSIVLSFLDCKYCYANGSVY
jgi:hypothetical protein